MRPSVAVSVARGLTAAVLIAATAGAGALTVHLNDAWNGTSTSQRASSANAVAGTSTQGGTDDGVGQSQNQVFGQSENQTGFSNAAPPGAGVGAPQSNTAGS